MIAFEEGQAYVATPAMRDAGPQRVIACVRRTPLQVTLVDVRGLRCARVHVVCGRETVKIRGADGVDYFSSAAAVADAVDATAFIDEMIDSADL